MNDPATRGSSHLAPMSAEDLHKAIGTARENYKIKRWIIKGTPPIYDRLQAMLDIPNAKLAGEVLQGLVNLQTPNREIGIDVFPYGIPRLDGVLVELNIEHSTLAEAGH